MLKHIAIACVALFCFVGSSAAQQPMPITQGPLMLEPITDGVVIAPDVKFTDFGGLTGTLVGAYGGVIKDDQFFIGGGGYGLVHSNYHGDSLGYGGMIVGWFFNPHQPVGAGIKSLVGFGEATMAFNQTVVVPVYPDPRHPTGPVTPPTTVTETFYQHTHFMIFEPEVDLVARLGSGARISAGVGYRVTTDDYYHPHVRGVTGSLSVQFVF